MEKIDFYINKIWLSINIEFVVKFFIVYFFAVWIALIIWVIKDISIRTNNIFYQIFCLLLIFFLSPLGIFIYLIIRPSNTLYEKYYLEVEENLDIINQIVKDNLEKKDNKKK